MKSITDQMTRFNSILTFGYTGESTAIVTGVAGGAASLGFFDIITPIVAFLAVVVAIVSGLYTLRLTRMKITDIEKARQEKSDA